MKTAPCRHSYSTPSSWARPKATPIAISCFPPAGARRSPSLLTWLFNGMHPDAADGHSASWLAALVVLAGELAEVSTLYPGHGDPAGPDVLAEQRRYLLYYRELVRRLSGGRTAVPPSARAGLDPARPAFPPGAQLTWMIDLGADAVAGELAASAGPPKHPE